MSGAVLFGAAARVRRAILLALVFGVPTLFLWGVTHDPFNVPKLALLTVGVALAGAIRVGEWICGSGPPSRRLLWPALFVLLPLLVSWLATDYKGWSLIGQYRRFEGLVPTALIVAAGVLTSDAFAGRLRSLARAFGASAAVVAAYTVIQSVGLDPLNIVTVEYAPSTLGQSNFVGGFLAISLPVLLGLWWVETAWRRYAAIGSTVLVALGVIFAFSQGGWAAAVAGVLAFAGLAWSKTPRWRAAGIVAAGLVALGVVAIVIAGMLLPADSPVPATARARGMWWQSAVDMGVESPLWGHGPNVFALESGYHRTLEDALAHEMAFADAPHSVPLSLFANAGALGLAGFALLVAWTVRTLLRGRSQDILAMGFGASAVAYFVQSLVSLDSVVLAFALWVCLGGLAAARTATNERFAHDRRIGHVGGAVMVGLIAVGACLWWSGRFLIADAKVQDAAAALREGRFDDAESDLRSALEIRFDPEYNTLLVETLGRAALAEPAAGGPYIERMRAEGAYLHGFPTVAALSVYGNRMHQWSVYDPSARSEAVEALLAAQRLDPHNPVLVESTAEALITSGHPEDAVDMTANLVRAIEDNLPAYRASHPSVPATLAIASHAAGDQAGARSALEAAFEWAPSKRAVDCHVIVARVLVAGGDPETYEATRDRYPNLSLCQLSTLTLLPGFEPDAG